MVNIIQKEDLASTSFSNDNSLASQGIEVRVDPGSTVGDAINNAIAALPGDKYLQGLQSYDAGTNTLTLLMNDGSTITVDMTGLVNDAVAEGLADLRGPQGVEVYGNDTSTLLGYLVAP